VALKYRIALPIIALILLGFFLNEFSEPPPEKNVILSENFESGAITAACSGNCPTITQKVTNSGSYAMEVHLDKNLSKINYRTEIQEDKKAIFGEDYWYQFSVYLPASYTPDNVWEIVAQWHAVPDTVLGETWRNPVLSLSTTDGKWGIRNIWDSKPNTFVNHNRKYDGVEDFSAGEYQTDKWVTWKFHIIWSHLDDGVLEVWKNDELVATRYGPNCFNDKIGPYFKLGIYKGWKKNTQPSNITQRTLYFDDISINEQIKQIK